MTDPLSTVSAVYHNDHPLRHYDRTCPGCNPMTDLEMTRLCAEAMGVEHRVVDDHYIETPNPLHRIEKGRPSWWMEYRPPHDDAQAMALLKRFNLEITRAPIFDASGDLIDAWGVGGWGADDRARYAHGHQDLNRAIVECVAKMQAAKR